MDWFSNIDWNKIKDIFVFTDAKHPMLFNSGAFFLLFIGFMGIFFLLRNHHGPRVLFATLFSLFFYYKSSNEMVLLLVGVGLVDFFLGYVISRTDNKGQQKAILLLNVVFNLGILAFFKYRYFFLEAIGANASIPDNVEDMIIPAGISFFTFQAMAYTIDVYRGHLKATTNPIDFIFFISYFPHSVAGPIIRAQLLIPQLRKSPRITDEDVAMGLIYICSGLFKKVMIADYLYDHVKMVFDEPTRFTGFDCLMVTYAYAIRIYADFSGYSDMAIGMSRLLGIALPANFNSPYQATSITDFWRRWHISLSSWLRDYLYIPLGGNRKGSLATFIIMSVVAIVAFIFCLQPALAAQANFIPLIIWGGFVVVLGPLMWMSLKGGKESSTGLNLGITMLLGGLWHGPSWNFVFWGAAHGIALGFEKVLFFFWPPGSNPIRKALGWILTFHFVCFCWIFFNARTFDLAWQLIGQIVNHFNPQIIFQAIAGYSNIFLIVLLGYVLHFTPAKIEAIYHKGFLKSPLVIRALIVSIIIWITIQFMSPDVKPFIYYNF